MKITKIKSCKVIQGNQKVYDIQLDKNHYFFSNNILTHNCRLKNAMEDNVFSYTLGAGGIETGSKGVITLNINRIVQDWYKVKDTITLPDYISEITTRVHKYLIAWNDYLWDNYKSGLLTVYNAGLIDLDKQYVTVGINGFLEAAEFLGIKTKPNNKEYKQFAADVLTTIKNLNLKHRGPHIKFNTELVPAESAGAKLYEWDKKAGYKVPESRNLYNSYFYPAEDPTYDPITKMYLQGKDFIGCLDGGSAYHCGLNEHLSKKQYRHLMDVAIKAGCSYFTFNIPMYACDNKDCGYVSKYHVDKCPKCGATTTAVTRIIGYLKKVSNFSEARQIEAKKRYYANKDTIK